MRSCWGFSVVGTGGPATSWLESHPWAWGSFCGTWLCPGGDVWTSDYTCDGSWIPCITYCPHWPMTLHSVSHFLGKYYIQWKILNLAQKVYPDQGARELLRHRTATHVLLASLPPQPALVGPWMERRELTLLHDWAIASWRWQREARKLIGSPGTRENCWCPLDINGPFFSRAFRKPWWLWWQSALKWLHKGLQVGHYHKTLRWRQKGQGSPRSSTETSLNPGTEPFFPCLSLSSLMFCCLQSALAWSTRDAMSS